MCSIWNRDYNVNCHNDFNDDYDIQILPSYGQSVPKINNGHKYYPIRHNTEYSVKLDNNTDKRCNVVLFIDGKEMGIWRINAYSNILLERSSKSSRKFTFVRENSWQAMQGNVIGGTFKNGLVEAKFIPEKVNFRNYDVLENNSNPFMCGSKWQKKNCEKMHNFNSAQYGATVLGEESSQRFGTAIYMKEDLLRSVIKRVRLIVDEIDEKIIDRQQYVPIDTDDFLQCKYIKRKDDRIPPRIEKINHPKQHSFTSMISRGIFPESQKCHCIINCIHAQSECPLRYQTPGPYLDGDFLKL